MYFCVGGDGGYVGRDGHALDCSPQQVADLAEQHDVLRHGLGLGLLAGLAPRHQHVHRLDDEEEDRGADR